MNGVRPSTFGVAAAAGVPRMASRPAKLARSGTKARRPGSTFESVEFLGTRPPQWAPLAWVPVLEARQRRSMLMQPLQPGTVRLTVRPRRVLQHSAGPLLLLQLLRVLRDLPQ